MDSAAQMRPRSLWLEVTLLGILTLVAYLPSLTCSFVYDDHIYVVANPVLRGPLHLGHILSEAYPPGKTDQGLYRPTVTLSYFLDAKIWGIPKLGEINGFHLTNILIHALNVGLFVILLQRMGLRTWPIRIAGLIFSLHPVLTEAVGWITGRSDLLSTTFGLLAILTFLRSSRGASLALSFVFYILAMASKEHLFMLPFAVFWLHFCFPKLWHGTRARAIFLGALSALVLGAFWFWRFRVLGNWHPALTAFTDIVSGKERFATSLLLLWKYIGLWIWPSPLSVFHQVEPVTSLAAGLGLAATWAFLFWGLWRARVFFPWLAFAVGWFGIFIFPVSNLIIAIGATFGERFLYTSSLFFAPLAVLSAQHLIDLMARVEWRRSIYSMVVVVLAPALFVATWLRLNDWRTDYTLWDSAYHVYPHAFAVKGPLADALLREGRFQEAHSLASEALKQLEHQPAIYRKLLVPKLQALDATAQSAMMKSVFVTRFKAANELSQNLKTVEALEAYQNLVNDYPEEPLGYEALGDLSVRLANPVAALQNFERALELGRKTPSLFAKYAQTLSELGKKAEALLNYDEALKLEPLNPILIYNRAVVTAELGDYPTALAAFREANRVSPQMAAPHLNAAAILISLRKYDEAKEELKAVLVLDPKQAQALELMTRIEKNRR